MNMKATSKVKLTVVGIGLGLAGSLLSVNLGSDFKFNSQSVSAQEVSTACPLPTDIAVTFLNSKCQAVTLTSAQTFYRYYSGDNNKYGRYLTTDSYKTNVEVIRNLALNQEWGNRATMKLAVTLPAGTTVYKGIVGPQNPSSCYPGGGQQTFIQNTRDPNIKWTEQGNMIVEDFSCP